LAEDNFTLTTFYTSWKTYQDHLKEAIAPLTAEQLALEAAPHLRTVGQLALHIIGCRAGWFTFTLGEDWGDKGKMYAEWDARGAPPRSAAEMVEALDYTWQGMADCLARWSSDDMQKTFEDDWGDGKIVHLSRAWIVYHVMEHDLHHGGELSLTLGMHGIPASFPG
jgi:uncharacterized damage-inducible protein DinB